MKRSELSGHTRIILAGSSVYARVPRCPATPRRPTLCSSVGAISARKSSNSPSLKEPFVTSGNVLNPKLEKRENERALKRLSDRAIERLSDRAIERLSDGEIERLGPLSLIASL